MLCGLSTVVAGARVTVVEDVAPLGVDVVAGRVTVVRSFRAAGDTLSPPDRFRQADSRVVGVWRSDSEASHSFACSAAVDALGATAVNRVASVRDRRPSTASPAVGCGDGQRRASAAAQVSASARPEVGVAVVGVAPTVGGRVETGGWDVDGGCPEGGVGVGWGQDRAPQAVLSSDPL